MDFFLLATSADVAATSFVGIFFLLFFLIWAFMILAILGGFILWVLMIIDVVGRNFKDPNEKILWVLVIVLTGIIGAFIYYFMVKRKDKKEITKKDKK